MKNIILIFIYNILIVTIASAQFGSLSGTAKVKESPSFTLKGIQVILKQNTSPFLIYTTELDSSGNYHFGNVAEGTYTLAFDSYWISVVNL